MAFLAVLLLPFPSLAADNEFEAQGQARVQGGDMVKARASALEDSLEAAVTIAAESVLARDAGSLEIANPQKYVSRYTVIEEQVKDGEARIKIKAVIDIKLLRETLLGSGQPPQSYTLEIKGLASYGQLKSILEALSSTAGVDKVVPRRFGGGAATLTVSTPLKADALVTAISNLNLKNIRLKASPPENNVIKVDVLR